MKKVLLKITSAMFALSLAAGAQAAIITLSGPGVTTTSVAGATVVDFNDGTIGAYTASSGDYAIVSGNLGGVYAEPLGTDAPYLTVPLDQSSGSATFDLGFSANYFGLYWGSIDAYNSISFWSGGSMVDSFTGSDIVSPADGGQGSTDTNRYVNFDFGAMSFDQVMLSSTSYAFESDNHAFALVSVPEPGVVVLFGLGILGLGLSRRRARKA
ncbi:Npun_F0296 family exosortase-dependent surface protein [Marinimicrobium alkaliphilum]|uniref:Npun_F0296 family exosortase-dependent surface protein n=1 Tax=Marinimicrobium alkaliphilum TaxID=2202654 RepID=UPI000DBAC658|nr:PEP-CTERM sorting domain-containing protein [Marinimicrobium alkaliphilum]